MRLACLLSIAIVIPASALAEPVDYARQVRPLLAARCYTCHGALKQQANLRLDTAASIVKGGDSGAAVSAGKSGESVLIQRITTADLDQRMPPEGEGSALTTDEIALLKAWIDQGAAGPANEKPEPDPREHWAFRAPVRPALPVLKDSSGLRREARAPINPIDAFIAAEYEQRGLKPQPAAEKMILLRRVYLDLIGLPPTAAQMAAFAADTSDDAYEKVVNRLLDSPQYGERWGRHWMDIWRYSDWWGLGAEVRNSQKHIWHWRDWIVESLNEDVGYDEMVRQMIAADELYPNDLNKLRASGYLARQYFKFNRNSWMEETVEHTAKGLLGMTLACARCHDHKYDPVSQRDYYRFRAFFEPYQIRTDQVTGETDYEKDGVPRAFDCNLAVPTYLFRRGDDKKPVTDEPLTPGLPPLLSFEDLKIEPVTLPAEAHQPGLRPWVEENYLKLAEREIATAKATLEAAKKTLADAESKARQEPSPPSEDAKQVAKDDFAAEKPDLWKVETGEWKYVDGKLVQKAEQIQGVFALQAAAPPDFVARFKYTPTGGKMWKSVGLSFDLAGENDVLVYLSCVDGGSKLQVCYKQSGANYIYPNEGTQPRPLKVGETQDVVVRVRGPLINMQVNGEHALAYRLPIERKPGKLALITYDAVAEFQLFELSPLPADYALKVPTGGKPEGPVNVQQAKAALVLAEKTLAAHLLGPNLVRARIAADRAKFVMPPAENAAELVRIATTAERQADLAKAELVVAQRELDLLKADPAKRAEAEKNLVAGREALDKAKAAISNPGEAYTSLPGALKTAESNLETPESMRKPFPTTSTGRRTALARWMTDRRHPTAARVAVNHIWLRHMGAPLVPTVFDFGRKGTPPTHPQLLDWLAVELMENNWSMKHLHRLIVTSQTYRLTSSARGGEANLKNDAENRCYWRMNPARMESETLRDSLLHLAGELDLTRGGPSVPLPATDSSKRRSLYFVHSHNEHSNLLSMFDDANVLDCYRRDQSIVPQQALALSNSKLSLEAAVKIATKTSAVEDTDFVRRAFVLLLASEPGEDEAKVCLEALADWQKQGIAVERARANLVQSLLNHNDFITVR